MDKSDIVNRNFRILYFIRMRIQKSKIGVPVCSSANRTKILATGIIPELE